MVVYSCPRCLYKTKQRRDIRKHFMRKNPCRIIAEDISIEQCFQRVLGEEYKKTLKFPQNPSKKEENPSFSLKKTLKSPSKSLNFPQNPSISLNFPQFHSKNEGIPSKKNTETKSGAFLRDKSPNKNYYNHIKQESDSEEGHICKYCGKSYSRKDNLMRHIKICKERPENSEACFDEVNNSNNCDELDEIRLLTNYDKTKMVSYEEVKMLLEAERNREREKSEYIIGELKQQIEVLLKNQGSNNTHTTNYNIMINSFGKENLDYISTDYINTLIKNGPVNSIPTLLKYIHFNPEHKENHNIKISNKKENYAQIFNGVDWEYRDKKATISDMSDRAYDILNNHYQVGNNSYMDTFKEQYEERSKSLYKRVHRDTEMMILSNQKQLNQKQLPQLN